MYAIKSKVIADFAYGRDSVCESVHRRISVIVTNPLLQHEQRFIRRKN